MTQDLQTILHNLISELILSQKYIIYLAIMSYDRSIAPSKVSLPQSVIQCFLFQFPVYLRLLKVVQ